jgi:putative hemolysin
MVMTVTVLEVLLIGLLIVLNGFFALSELAIISARKVKLQHLANQGDDRARLALELASSPSLFLSSVQVGITLIGILAGALGGATLTDEVSGLLSRIPILRPYAQTIGFLLVVITITFLSLIIGELVPKRFALLNPEVWAVRVAKPMRVVATVASPIVTVLSATSEAVLRLFRGAAAHRPPISDEEISMLFEEGITAGVFERAEKEIVNRLFHLSDRQVNAVMTLRSQIIWLEAQAPRDEVLRVMAEHPFSAYPVCEENLDHVIGIVYTKDLIPHIAAGQPLPLAELAREPLILTERFSALRAIERLKEREAHLAVIIDEYGATEGLLTFTDILESLIGEIIPSEEPAVIERSDGSLLVDGLLPTDELKEVLAVPSLPQEERGDYHTLAGFLMTYTGKVPDVGDVMVWEAFRFEVVDMDGTRIDRVLISRLPTPPLSD